MTIKPAFHTQPSLGTENGPKKKECPVSGGALGESEMLCLWQRTEKKVLIGRMATVSPITTYYKVVHEDHL